MFDEVDRAELERADLGKLDALSDRGLEAEIVDLSARIASATCRWLGLVAEFDRRRAYEGAGFHCCSAWLAWACSLAPRSAREHVRVAGALEELPQVRAAMAAGGLSYSKARVLTRIATPELEAELLELALQATAAQLERIARTYARAISVADAEAVHERRYLSYTWEQDGSLSIRGSLSAEDGATLLRALEAGREEIRAEGAASAGGPEHAESGSAEPFPERPLPRAAVNADALVLMSESLLAHGARTRAAAERAQVVVHVDAGALVGDGGAGKSEGSRRCEIEEGAPVAPETARRLSCDAARVEVLEGPEGPLDVGRRTRTVPAAMRRALSSRDGGCRFPGCENHRWTDAHHIKHWAEGGETSAENLVQLCRRHHRLVHEGGFGVERGPGGELRFWRPDGTLIEAAPRSRPAHGSRRRFAPLSRVRGNPESLGKGESFDLDLTVAVLASRTAERPLQPRGP